MAATQRAFVPDCSSDLSCFNIFSSKAEVLFFSAILAIANQPSLRGGKILTYSYE